MSDFNFSNVKAREIEAATVRDYTISELENSDGSSPVLRGTFAGEKNRQLRKAINAMNAKRGRGRGEMSNDALLLAARENVRALFPQHVLRDWEDVVDGDGVAVEFSREASEAFLRALPDWILQGVIEFFGTPSNFAGDAPTEGDIADTSGN